MSPKRKAKWINGEKMIITDVIFRWVQLIQKQCWENIHIHIIAGETIQRRPASFSGVRLMNEPTHWPRQTPRRARNAHPSIHPSTALPSRTIHFVLILSDEKLTRRRLKVCKAHTQGFAGSVCRRVQVIHTGSGVKTRRILHQGRPTRFVPYLFLCV